MKELKTLISDPADGVVLVSFLLTYFTPYSSVSIVNFEQVNADWVTFQKVLNTLLVSEAKQNETKNRVEIN